MSRVPALADLAVCVIMKISVKRLLFIICVFENS